MWLQDRIEEKELYQAMLDAMRDPHLKTSYTHQGISYSYLKSSLTDGSWEVKIKEATEDGILQFGHGTVSFTNLAIFNAALKLI